MSNLRRPNQVRTASSEPAVCSGKQSSSVLIYSGESLLTSIIIGTDGSNNATVVIYDNTSGSGKVVREFVVKGSDNFGGNTMKYPVIMDNGIYLSLSGTGAFCVIDYIP